MPATSILLKFKVHSLTDTYHAVGTSAQGSFNKELGRGRDLIVGGGVVTEDDLKLGVGIETQISLDGKYGEFTIRVYAENELGLRSKYVEVVKQVLGPSVDGTYSFGDVHVAAGEVVSREFVGSDTYDIGNTTKVNLDFRGASPNLNWSLLAPPGHALEGNQLDSSMVKEDGFFDKFVISFWRPNGSGNYDILDSDDEAKMIDDIFGDILEDMGSGKWQSQTFFLNFPESSSTNFSGLAGGSNKRKLLIKIEAHAIKFNANDQDKISHLEVTLENSKTKLKTNFVETVANDFIFSYEAQDIDLSRVEVLQYRQTGLSTFGLVKTFGGPSDSGVSKVQLGTIKAQQKWSNGRGDSGNDITSLVNVYKYVIAVYDSFGLSSAYAPKVDGGFEEKDSIADALDASNRTFESVVKIGNVTIADVADKFNISWSLVDARGNGISFDNDSNSDFASVVSGVVGYFHRAGDSQGAHPIIDAFKVNDAGDRFASTPASLNISELKQEYGVTLIPNISKDENKRIQEKLYDDSTREASRSIYFTLKLLDSRGEVIDELEVSGTNEQPTIELPAGGLKIHNTSPVGSISFDFEFSENIESVKIYRKPRKVATVTTAAPQANEVRYAQRSHARSTEDSPFGLVPNTPMASKYNDATTPSSYFGYYIPPAGSAADRLAAATTYAEEVIAYDGGQGYFVSEQKLSGPNPTETDPGTSSATIVDKDVPMAQVYGDGWVTDVVTLYDYVIVPYDTFGAGVPHLIRGQEVIAYLVTTKDDKGFVGQMDIIRPPAPENFKIKSSFKTFFLSWDAPRQKKGKIDSYKVTMIRDSRPLKDRNATSIQLGNGNLNYEGTDNTVNRPFIKWVPRAAGGDYAVRDNGSWAAVSSASGEISKVGLVENETDSWLVRTRAAEDGTFTEKEGSLKIVGGQMHMSKAGGDNKFLDANGNPMVTFEEYIVDTTSLAIEGEKNETGYFFLEAIDRVGNHSEFSHNGAPENFEQSRTLGQSEITDIFGFEQEITKKFPGAIVLVPSEPFDVVNEGIEWEEHILYSNGEGTLMKAGAIKMRPAADESGYEFLGPEVEIDVELMVDGGVYEIKTPGDTDFTLLGAPNSTEGTIFVATGPGTGSGKVKIDKYIQSIYWDPAGGYDTVSGTFKSTTNDGGKANERLGGPLEGVDENVEYEKTGYYSFSVFNPASATYNIKDGIDTSDATGYNAVIRSPAAGNYGFQDFIEVATSLNGRPTQQTIDITAFTSHWGTTISDAKDDLVKYNSNNGEVSASSKVVDMIKAGYGIHMPLESRGEGEPKSIGKRNPLVKPREKNVVGSVVVGRINLKPDFGFSVTSSWHAFANAVIGTAMIGDATIKTAHVNDLSADVLTSGEIHGHEIILGERKAIGEPVQFGSISSLDYLPGGINSTGTGFAIHGDGTFSFSSGAGGDPLNPKKATSLSFDGEGLNLRGYLNQPDGTPGSSIRLYGTADQVLIQDFQVPNVDGTAGILSPDGGDITVYGTIKGAFDARGLALGAENVVVKVYPEDLADSKQITRKASYAEFSDPGQGPDVGHAWWWASSDPVATVNDGNNLVAWTAASYSEGDKRGHLGQAWEANSNTNAGDEPGASPKWDNIGELNDGIKIELDFGVNSGDDPQGIGLSNKFLKREHGEIPALADYFSVEVRLKYVNLPSTSSGGIQWAATKSYRSGDYVINDGNIYQAKRSIPSGDHVPTGTSDISIDGKPVWSYIGDGQDGLTIDSDIFIIKQLREASDALSFQLRPNEGTVVKGDSAGYLDFTPWLIYGSTSSYDLTNPQDDNPVWVQDVAKNIRILREVVVKREPDGSISDYDEWSASEGYDPGDVVKSNDRIFTCYDTHPATATNPANNSAYWQEETLTKISKSPMTSSDEKITWESFKLGDGVQVEGNRVYRDSFGIDGSVKFQNILFTMEQHATMAHVDATPNILDTLKFTLLQDGNSAGELSFYAADVNGDRTSDPKYAITRELSSGLRKKMDISEKTYFTCNFIQGADLLPGPSGYLYIEADAGDPIVEGKIFVKKDNGDAFAGGLVEISVDDATDVSRITLRVKLLNPGGGVIAVGTEQIDIISIKPEHKAFRLTLKRDFVEFDGSSHAVSDNLLSVTNMVPLQVFLGAENVVSKFNLNDGIEVVPSFGWVASGEALDNALKDNAGNTGRIMPPNTYGDSTTGLRGAIAAGSLADAVPAGDLTFDPYYIYKDGSDYKFNIIKDSAGSLEAVELSSTTSNFFFYIPDSASGEEAVKKRHGLSLKATYNRHAGGLDGIPETYEDIEEVKVIENVADGVNPFWVTSKNQNMIVSATDTGKMSIPGTSDGEAEVNVYRGNKEVFLAPKKIKIGSNVFTLNAGSAAFEYTGGGVAINAEVDTVELEWEDGIKGAGDENFKKIKNGTPTMVRVSRGGDSFPRNTDNQKRHVVILDNGGDVLQFGDFSVQNTGIMDGSKFSQTDFIAWPSGAADIATRPTNLSSSSYNSLEIESGKSVTGVNEYRLASNFALADGEQLLTATGGKLDIAGIITTVYIYDNKLGIRAETSFERSVGLAKTGAPGPSFAYRGEYSPFRYYRGDDQRIDVVKYTDPTGVLPVKHYKAISASGPAGTVGNTTFPGAKAPPNSTYWDNFNELQSTATDLLLASDVFVKRGIVTGIDREVGTQQQPSFIASQLESRYYNLSSSFDPHAMGGIQKGIDFTNNGTPISNTHPSLESYLADNFSGSTTFAGPDAQGRIWYLDQTDWDYYIKETGINPPAGTNNIDAWARAQFLAGNGDKTYIRIRESVPDSATDGTRSIRSRRSQKTYKTPNDKLPGFFLGFDRIDTAVTNSSASGGADWAADDFYVPKFELRSVFGNYLYWDGNNLNIKGAIINASADDSNFLRLAAADDVLILSGPQNPDTGGQTFVGGGFNNELTPRLDNLGSSIMGGGANKISINETAQKPRFSVIGGGYGNEIHNPFSFIGGGYLNKIGGFVPKGETAAELKSEDGVNSIVGGSKNEILYSDYCAIGTGFGNAIQDSKYSTILNGYKNAIDGGDIEKRAFLDSTGEFRWGIDGPAFDDDIEGGITGVKCTVDVKGQSVDPFEWRLPFHQMDGRAGEEEVIAFYRYFMGARTQDDFMILHLTAGVKFEDSNPAWTAATEFQRNNLVKHNKKVWVCTRTSTGDKPDENSDVWYDVTFGRKYDPNGDPRGWVLDGSGNYLANGKFYRDIVKGAMSDARFARNAKWALDIGLNKETYYIYGTGAGRERKTEYERFDLIGGAQSDSPNSFDYDGKTWTKTVIPAHGNKNSAFSIFNNLLKITWLESNPVNRGGVAGGQSILSFAILLDAHCKVGDKKLYVRAESKHLNGALNAAGAHDKFRPRRIFDIGYYENNKFYWVPVTTSTWAWPVVYVPAFGTSKAYGVFKLGEDDEILWEPVGGDSETVAQLFTAVSFADISNSPNTASNAFSSNLSSMYGDGSKEHNRTMHAPASTVGGGSTNLANMKPNSIVTSVPEPNAGTHTESWHNTIVGGDYNKIAKSRRSTIVGGRGVSLFQVERAIVGGLGNLLIGTPSGTQLPKGFTVFGTENTISHESPDFIPHKDDPTQSNAGESYITSAGGTPSRFDALANTVFGSYNRVRNSDRMTVLGSNNDILFEDGGFKQTGSEITILGTDNKIEIDQEVDAVNLGIFGTNFTLTQPAMVQNTFYIGNPKIEDTTDLKALTRVFVAADGGMFVTGDVIAYALSDKKYKENVKLIESPLEKLLKIRGVTFDWNKDQDVYEGHDIGVLADEVEKVLPEVVESRRTGKAVRYEKLTPLLIEAVKAQQEIIDSLTARVEALESKR